MSNGSRYFNNTKLLLKGTCIKSIFLVLAIMTIGFPSFASTYYMATTGSNSNTGTLTAPWLTLAYSFSKMAGGDTLIIKNGTYTGSNNMIGSYDTAVEPPAGTSTKYTTIKAENDGGVVFDGQNARWMFYVVNSGARYWNFEGIIWSRMTEDTVYIQDASYIKFLRCGASDTANGNHMNFSMGNSASYILFEGCYSWGTGRYKFTTYHSNHVIFRNCVARPDVINAGGEPAACFTAYASTYVKFQNCIAIDADRTSYWTNIGDRQGSFFVPCTDGKSQYIDFDQCIGLNVKLGGLQTAKNTDSANVNFRNVVIWDCADSGDTLNMIRGSSNTISNCTLGANTCGDEFMYADGDATTVKNTIFYGNTHVGALLDDVETQNYNCYYANTSTTGISGSNNLTTINPKTNSLKYITRIESGSALAGKGESNADIGANTLTLIGTSGTLWGEIGYATNTGVSMWPFPNEALIKAKMAAYSNSVTGARGFCTGTSKDGTTQTLTKYIWEYLGNQIPTTIYASSDLSKPTGVKIVIISE